MSVKIYFKRLSPNAKAPLRAHPSDEGADLFAATRHPVGDYTSAGNAIEVIEYGTGLAFAIPQGYSFELRARSSIWKQGMSLCNGVGTIDQAYRNEVKAFFYSFSGKSYDVGDRICQLLLRPYVNPSEIEFIEVDELPTGEDRGGGFGSTGR